MMIYQPGCNLTHAGLEAPMEPTAPDQSAARSALADFGSGLQSMALASRSVSSCRPALAEPATGATENTLAAVAATVRFPQAAVGFDGLQRRLAQRAIAADATPVLEAFFTHLYAADAAAATDAIFGWLPSLDRLAAARGPLLPAALASASVRALRGSDEEFARIERAFTALFSSLGMTLEDARYSAYLTASATAAAASAALTAASVASGQSPADPALAATVAALAGARNPVADQANTFSTPAAREILAELYPLLDRQVRDMAIFIEAVHGLSADIFQHFEKSNF